MTRPMNKWSARSTCLRTRARTPLGTVILASAIVALALGVGGLGGCEKKKKIVKLPPTPPPAAPVAPPVSFDTLAQELKVDPRVQFSQDLAITDEAFARASLKLADALAKGDAKALGGMTVRRVNDGIALLESSKQWEPATRGLEAVRIIAAAPPPSSLSKIEAVAPPPPNIKEAEEQGKQMQER